MARPTTKTDLIEAANSGYEAVSYTHLTLPTNCT